jgi:hypothetical protein
MEIPVVGTFGDPIFCIILDIIKVLNYYSSLNDIE